MAPDQLTRNFVAQSPAMREVLQHMELVRDSAVAVLITGEKGSGRGAVARNIHHSGNRRNQPFVHVDCAELPTEMLDQILFGERDEGRFELAKGGTLFLDGIEILPLEIQERLLRVLERGTVQRQSGKRVVPVHARLIASTHETLKTLVDEGRFRKDLFCRLNVFPLSLPALRQRREDVAALAQMFLEKHQHERTPPVHAIEERALTALKAYGWPGNVKELEMVVLGAVLAAGNDRVVRVDNLPAHIRSGAPESAPGDTPPPASPFAMDGDTIVPLSELERRAIQHALRVTGGNVTRAARALGIGRATMYRKLDRFKLSN